MLLPTRRPGSAHCRWRLGMLGELIARQKVARRHALVVPPLGHTTPATGSPFSAHGRAALLPGHCSGGVFETGGARIMMTVVTTVTLKDETRNQWDRAMHQRVQAASHMDGWVAVQLLRDVAEPRRRAIIGTWQSLEQWARWHDDETFRATRAELAGLEDGPSRTVWYDVVEGQG